MKTKDYLPQVGDEFCRLNDQPLFVLWRPILESTGDRLVVLTGFGCGVLVAVPACGIDNLDSLHGVPKRLTGMPEIGRYRHFKGGIYQVLGSAFLLSTGESLVIYRSESAQIEWARTLSRWNQFALSGNLHVPRFTRL